MLQLSLLAPESEWEPPNMADLPSWKDAKRVSIDIETKDLALSKDLGVGCKYPDCEIIGISFCLEGHRPFYLPFRHYAGGNLDEKHVLRYIKDQAFNFTGELVGANLAYDLGFLLNEKIWFHNAKFIRDVLISDVLIYELHNSYSLQNVGNRYGLVGKSEGELKIAAKAHKIDPKSEMWKLHSKYVGTYAEQDAELPLKILSLQEKAIVENDLQKVWDLESKVLPILVRMRDRGVLIDQKKLEYIVDWSKQQEINCLEEVKARTGINLKLGDINKKQLLVKVFDSLGLPLEQTKTGQPKIDKDTFENVDHPVMEALSRAKKMNKLRTTFATSIEKRLINGRIHCTFNQLAREADQKEGIVGARWGRMSSEQPNLQQQPARDDFAKLWRSIYIADPGYKWASLDYSQQEPRMLVHFAELCELPRAREVAEAYRKNPDTDNHQMMADMTGLPRKEAKNLFLGKCYGVGGAKFCRELGLPTREITNRKGTVITVAGEEGQRIIDQFDEKLPFVKLLAEMTAAKAAKVGFIRTISGRRCHFPIVGGKYDWTHKALNRLIQGSSADQTKMAMVALEEAGHAIQLQIHDEVDASVRDRKQAEEMAEIMSNCANLSLKFKVDMELGESWGDAC